MGLQQQEGQRAPYEPGAADNDGALAGGIDALAAEQLEHPQGRRGNEGWISLGEAAGIVRMQTVDIFMWRDLLECLIRIEAVRQRHLDEDAVDRGIVCQGQDALVQIGLRDVVKMLNRRLETDLFRGLVLAANVRRGREVIADLDDGYTGTALSGMTLDSEFQLLADGARVGAAVDQAGRHRLSLVSGPGDLDGKGVEIRQGRSLAHADGDLDHLGILQERGRDPFRHCLQQIGWLAFEDLAGSLLEKWVADGVLDAVRGGAFSSVDGHLEVSYEDLA